MTLISVPLMTIVMPLNQALGIILPILILYFLDFLVCVDCSNLLLLEHLDDPFGVMKEFHRISKNGAVIHIKVPHFTRGFMHPEHKRGFDVSFPLYFRPSFKGGYQGCDLKLQKMKLNWFAQPYLKKEYLSKPAFYVGYLVGAFVSFFANLSPFFCSRFWCYLVGGFEEIEFEFLVVK